MDSRMKEICIINCPAVMRRCSDDKKRGPQAFAKKRSREAGSTGLHVHLRGFRVVSVPRASQLPS